MTYNMYTKKIPVTRRICYGIPQERVTELFYTMPQKMQWPARLDGKVGCDTVECTDLWEG